MRLARHDLSTRGADRLAAVALWAGMIMVLVPMAPPGLALAAATAATAVAAVAAVAAAASAASAASAAVVPIVVVVVAIVIALCGGRRLRGRLRDDRRRWGRGRDRPLRR